MPQPIKRHTNTLLVSITIAVVFVDAAVALAQRWTDNMGMLLLGAEFVNGDDAKVALKAQDGTRATEPLAQLDATDCESDGGAAEQQNQMRLIVQVGEHAVNALAFSPDGQLVLTGSNDGIARLWHVASGSMLRKFEGRTDRGRTDAERQGR